MSTEFAPKSFPGGVAPSVSWQPFPAPVLQRYALNGATMGTRYSAIFFGSPGADTVGINLALQTAVDLVDAQMSTWKPKSDLSRFNDAAVGAWIDIPRQLADVIATALDVGRASSGAFDIGVGDLVDAWGFGPAGKLPDAARVGAFAGAPRPVTADLLDLDRDAGRLRKRGAVRLDLSGIAKGFGVDELARVLDAAGIADYLVSIDGEMRARGHKPDGKSWVVAIERPVRGTRDVAGVIELSDIAIATSGDYRHWVELDGRVASHTMDPRTGKPLSNALASVTVLADDCMRADAWATVLMVLGEIEGPRLAKTLSMDALFIVRGPDGLGEIPVGRFVQA